MITLKAGIAISTSVRMERKSSHLPDTVVHERSGPESFVPARFDRRVLLHE